MKLEITTPEDSMGDLVGDLQQRRGIVSNTENRGNRYVIHAEAPLAELFGYSSAMRSLSKGLAGHSMEPLKYAPAPPAVAESFTF
jgi:elongation factor G